MTNTLKINFDKFRNGYLKGLLDIIENTFKSFNVNFYLIGANSRDLWIEGINLNNRVRATYDIDFAIYINTVDIYRDILNDLKSKGFKETDKIYRLIYNDTPVDIIPFGNVEKDNKVEIPDKIPWFISVSSYKETLEHSVSVDENYNIVPLHGLCIMKLIAYYDRPDDRQRDIDDFLFLLDNYYNISYERIIKEFPELFADEGDERIVGARVLGKDMNEILNSSSELKEKTVETLRGLLDGKTDNEITESIGFDIDDKQIKKFKLVLEVIREIEK